ncbi:MAG: hypothetical protein KC486_18755 [Myxococcales bacterium]|nr:hypothetical protein [Myxococcales bacterium]
MVDASTSAASDPLVDLGDALLRAQEVTGIAPTEPAEPVYRQAFGPRRAEALRRLEALGYRGDARTKIAQFKAEAAIDLGRAPFAIDDPTWDALDELRGLEAKVDPARWRDRDGRWLPAMRRAIAVRRRELALDDAGPVAFGLDAEDDGAPPDVRATDDDLDAVAEALSADADDGQLLTLLFDQEALFEETEAAANDPLAFGLDDARPRLHGDLRRSELGLLGLDDDEAIADLDDPAGDDEEESQRDADEPLAFGLRDTLGSIRQFFRDLVDKPKYRRRPSAHQLRLYLISVVRLLDRFPDIGARWRSFTDDQETVWQGKRRSGSWLHGAVGWLRERGRGLVDGLVELIEGAKRAARKLAGYVTAIFTNLFRVLYHDLAKVFEHTHRAASTVVAHLKGVTIRRDGRMQAALRRHATGAAVVVAPTADADDLQRLDAQVRFEDELFTLSAELLGLVLGITASWILASLSPLAVLSGLGSRAQRIIYVGQRLAALAANAPEAA